MSWQPTINSCFIGNKLTDVINQVQLMHHSNKLVTNLPLFRLLKQVYCTTILPHMWVIMVLYFLCVVRAQPWGLLDMLGSYVWRKLQSYGVMVMN